MNRVNRKCKVLATLRASRLLLLGLACLMVSPLFAQYERLGGVYFAYPMTETKMAAAPEGYEPFYISHYGRHGSRWLPDDKRYVWVNRQFENP